MDYRKLLWALIALLFAPCVAAQVNRPGVVDLAGTWHYRIGGVAAAGDTVVWRGVSLPTQASSIQISDDDDSLWLRREIVLGKAWETELAPSGLALLITRAQYGDFQVLADGELIGSWSGPPPDIAPPPPQVFAVPEKAIDRDGRLRLDLHWTWQEWVPERSRHASPIGDGWLVGDKNRLEMQAELRRAEQLNADLPLAILVLLYTAIGLYHLQLFRRDRRCGEYLWFGLTALLVAINTLLFTHWISGITDHYVAIRRLYDVTGNLMLVASIQFLWPFLLQRIGPWLRAYQLSFLGWALIISIAPESVWAVRIEALSKLWSLPFLPAVVSLVIRKAWRGNAEARTIAVGGLAIATAGSIEMSSQLLGYGSTFPLQSVAFTVFALSMAFSLSNRFSRVHGDLDALRLQLEEMVVDRTGELSTANERLQSQIAERELAQEAMRMLERAVEQSIDGILVTGLDEDIVFTNDAWADMHGREGFEIFGRRLEIFHSPEQMTGELRPALIHVREEGSWDGQIDHRRKDGSVFPTWMSITLLRDPAGEPVGFVAVARDITERQRAAAEKQRIEARIQEAEKLSSLAKLAGGIAHDYNNLLTGVLGNASLAFSALPAASPAAEKLVHIGTAADRAADLTAQLLSYAGAGPSRRHSVDLNKLVAASSRGWLECAPDGVQVDIHLGNDLPEILIDEQLVSQAITNLVNNAMESLAAGGGVVEVRTGEISVDASYLSGAYPTEELPADDCVFVSVSDTGIGIERKIRARVFDPFFTTKLAGRGLGLASVLSTVRAHGGTIKLESALGQGASFELLFPRIRESVEEVAKAGPSNQTWRSSGVVLVVDDEQLMREVSRSILEGCGFEVLTAEGGQQALELYREHWTNIRLVLLDRTMPDLSGLDVLEGILALNQQAQVLLMSGYELDSTTQRETAPGISGFLPKPFRPEELLAKVQGILEPEPRG